MCIRDPLAICIYRRCNMSGRYRRKGVGYGCHVVTTSRIKIPSSITLGSRQSSRRIIGKRKNLSKEGLRSIGGKAAGEAVEGKARQLLATVAVASIGLGGIGKVRQLLRLILISLGG